MEEANALSGKTPWERFWDKVLVTDSFPLGPERGPCWEWTACTSSRGYGKFRLGGRVVLVHRYSYERVNGPIPEGFQLDHLCRNHPCVNDAHLEAVTGLENIRRGMGAYCVNGHEYTEDNVYIHPDGLRRCRKCRRERHRYWREHQRDKRLVDVRN